jgi:hypothetical protein
MIDGVNVLIYGRLAPRGEMKDHDYISGTLGKTFDKDGCQDLRRNRATIHTWLRGLKVGNGIIGIIGIVRCIPGCSVGMDLLNLALHLDTNMLFTE